MKECGNERTEKLMNQGTYKPMNEGTEKLKSQENYKRITEKRMNLKTKELISVYFLFFRSSVLWFFSLT